MPPAGFEPTIAAGDRPQTYALDRAATGTGFFITFFLSSFFLLSLQKAVFNTSSSDSFVNPMQKKSIKRQFMYF